ncbi:MAG: DNA internalization-related competence protein ComEC/Rec2 [Gammaproteobacteria bacterium]|nr:DNA internalization-related competence protein ComEC/Rec2 [Gammaproteobacteria bacterium]
MLVGCAAPLAWPSLAEYPFLTLLLAGFTGLLPRMRPLAWLLFGLAVGGQAVGAVRDGWLPAPLEGESLVFDLRIDALPEARVRGVVFIAEVVRAPAGQELGFPRRLRLSWYKDAPRLIPGEVWRVNARLKRPHGTVNGFGFDYEAWLFRQGIQATGTVHDGTRLVPAPAWGIDGLRLAVRERLVRMLAGEPSLGLILGLVIGDRSLILESQWDDLIATGTNHLLAISGLHVTMIAGLIWGLVRGLWAWIPALALRCPAPFAGAIAGGVGALGYSLLAGFSVPTQRTLLMLLTVVLALLSRCVVRTWDVLGLALLFVLLWDPLSVLDVGFWLSFGAVGLLVYAGSGRLVRPGWLREAGHAQLAISLGLLPLTLLLFQRGALVSPLANAIAIPLVSLVVTPLALAGSALALLAEPLAHALLWLAARLLDGLMGLLHGMAAWPMAQWFPPKAQAWAFLLAIPALVWLLAPVGVPARWVGLLLLAPLIWPHVPQPGPGELWLDMLDVGQGQAILVRTAGHAMLYDVGPLGFGGFDAGAEVVLPVLRGLGVERLDAVVLSNGDRDHAGGWEAIRSNREVLRLWQGGGLHEGEPCRKGKGWDWDGVHFVFLHPVDGFHGGNDNDQSCVLRIHAPGGSVLLTGDIERRAEAELLKEPDALRATVVQVPHHGSATSSSTAFVEAAAPRIALISAGYRNNFRHPRPEVVARWQEAGAVVLDTPACGRIRVRLAEAGAPEVDCARLKWLWAWRVPGTAL